MRKCDCARFLLYHWKNQCRFDMLVLSGVSFPCRFDIEGHVTGFGNPDWARTHTAATSTSPAVLSVLGAGATCVGKTVMDEMAYRLGFKEILTVNPISLVKYKSSQHFD